MIIIFLTLKNTPQIDYLIKTNLFYFIYYTEPSYYHYLRLNLLLIMTMKNLNVIDLLINRWNDS